MSKQDNKVNCGIGLMIQNSNGEILLGLRNKDSRKADSDLKGEGTWTFPGGKMDFGESVFKSAKRELEEETDLTLEEMELITINNNISGTAHYLTLGFKVLKYKGDVKVMEPDEIVIWKWFSLDKLPERIYFPTERIIHFYKEKKFIDLKEI